MNINISSMIDSYIQELCINPIPTIGTFCEESNLELEFLESVTICSSVKKDWKNRVKIKLLCNFFPFKMVRWENDKEIITKKMLKKLESAK